MTDAPKKKAAKAGHPEIPEFPELPEIPPGELAAMVREASLGDSSLQMLLAEYYSQGPAASRSGPRAMGMLRLASLHDNVPGAKIWRATFDLWFGRRPFPGGEAAISAVRRGAEAGDPEFVCAWGGLSPMGLSRASRRRPLRPISRPPSMPDFARRPTAWPASSSVRGATIPRLRRGY